MSDESLFHQALERPPHEREAFVRQACGSDETLRQRVETLLAAHEHPAGFLTSPCVGSADDPNTVELDFLSPPTRPGALGKLGHYEILEIVGSGGFGVVYKAFDEHLQRIVAIKTISRSLASSVTARKRFEREAIAAAAVNHENVVDIHAVDCTGPAPFLVMEYVAGISLDQQIKQHGPLGVKEVVRVGLQIAEGLAAAHKQGLVHRDVKPANILLENGVQRVKITDFGLARLVDDVSLTQTGLIAGTPSYMSPEQAHGDPVDHRSDLFSLGSVLYAMCAGQPPFKGGTSLSVLKRVCEESPRPIRELNPDIPAWLCELIARLQSKQPAERFQSAAEIAELLNARLAALQHPAGNELGIQNTPCRTSETVRPPARVQNPISTIQNRWTLVIGAALFIALLALSLTEAGGVTHLAASVIRIMTPRGTLVVETNDPGIKVTVEGDGGLVINGAGLEEIRLHPGNYKVRADRNGQPVPLERELVRITQGDREVVKVKLERLQAPVIADVTKPFVLVGASGTAVRGFTSLAEAVTTAMAGETIEVRGNGPFLCPNFHLQSKPLTIRAAAGFRPVLKLSEAGRQPQPLIDTQASLVVEGLEFEWFGRTSSGNSAGSVIRSSAPLHLANCRFHLRRAQSINVYGVIADSPRIEVRNCQFDLDWPCYAMQWNCPRGGQFTAENNIFGTQGFGIGVYRWEGQEKVGVRLARNTFQLHNALALGVLDANGKLVVGKLRVDARENVLSGQQYVVNWNGPKQNAAADFRRLVHWQGDRNAYGVPVSFLPIASPSGLSLADWQEQLGIAETDSLQDNLQILPDFRLASGSPGQGAGEGGRDLGADADLVGPGPAYERWKKTADYQAWRDRTRQVTAAAALMNSSIGIPTLEKPPAKAILPNGMRGGNTEYVWNFSWQVVAEADCYEFHVISPTGAVITQPVLTSTSHQVVRRSGYSRMDADWLWCVRAGRAGEWGPWSEKRPFRPAEPVDDPNSRPADPASLAQTEVNLRGVLATKPDDHNSRRALANVLRQQRKFPEAETECGELLRQIPGDLAGRELLGMIYAQGGRWKEAEAELARVAKFVPDNHISWYRLAALRLEFGDRAGYEAACQELLKRFENAEQPEVRERVAKACLLTSDGAGQLERAVALAEPLTEQRPHRYYWYFLVTRALAEYRAGHHAEAISWAEQAATPVKLGSKRPPEFSMHDAALFSILALAQQANGHQPEARASFAEAQRLAKEHLPDPAAGRPFEADNWNDWLICRLLMREAEQALKDSSDPPPDNKPPNAAP